VLSSFIHFQKPRDLKILDQKNIAINFAMICHLYRKKEKLVLVMLLNMILPNNI